jgi:hypothetical protein
VPARSAWCRGRIGAVMFPPRAGVRWPTLVRNHPFQTDKPVTIINIKGHQRWPNNWHARKYVVDRSNYLDTAIR